MTAITFTIGKGNMYNPFKVGEFVRMKRRRKMKDRFFMVSSIRTDEGSYGCTLVPPHPMRKKNGYAIDRLKKIYNHKPKKLYF